LGVNDVLTRTLTLTNNRTASLTVRLVETTTVAADGSVSGAPQPHFDIGVQVDAAVLNRARKTGAADFWVQFAERADLRPAYALPWEARGRFVYDALREVAARSQAPARAYLERTGVDYTPHWIVNALYVRGGDLTALQRLQGIEGVARIRAPQVLAVPEPVERGAAQTRAVMPMDAPWNLSIIEAPAAWATTRGEGIVVANIDTGVRYTHEALVPHYRGYDGSGFSHDYNWYDPQGATAPSDDHGHGTHTMGSMVGETEVGAAVGVAPGARWIAADGCDGSDCPDADLISSGEWLLAPCPVGVAPGSASCDPDRRPHLVNNSWGDCEQETTDFFEDVIDAWRAAGIYTAFANSNAGNCGYPTYPDVACNTVGNPARHYQVTGVGATDRYDNIASFSLRGPTDDPDPRLTEFADIKPEVSAPGAGVRSSIRWSDTAYASWSGTSMATPHVSGVAALVMSANPGLIGRPDVVEDVLKASADPKPYDTGCGNEDFDLVPNNAFGWGRVNARQAVVLAQRWDDVPWLTETPVTTTLASSATTSVAVTFNTQGMRRGFYTATLQLHDAGTDGLLATVPVTLRVLEPGVFRVPFASLAELDALAVLDVWEVHHDAGYLLAYVNVPQQQWLLNEGFTFERDTTFTPAAIPGAECYRTIAELDAQLAVWASSYPTLTQAVEIGQSYEGRPLTVLQLTNRTFTGEKPLFFLMANVHGRELITNEVAARFVEMLLEGYGDDPDVTWLLDEHEIAVLLSANPDGHVKNEGGVPWTWWRKNTQPYGTCDALDQGVDLNRNFPFGWGGAGASTDPCRDTYRGPSAASESETQAVMAYLQDRLTDRRPDDRTTPAPADVDGLVISLHSYGRLVLWPWGDTYDDAPNAVGLAALGEKLATFPGYTPQQASDLYPASGTTDDWVYGALGVPAYTFEIGDYFYPRCSSYDALVAPNLEALRYAARVARAPYRAPSGPDVADLTAAVTPERCVVITATVDDAENGGQAVQAAEIYLDAPPWRGGTSRPLGPADGAFDAVREVVTGALTTTGLPAGRRLVYVRGQDAAGAWGPPFAAWVTLPEDWAKLRGTVTETVTAVPLPAVTLEAVNGLGQYKTTTGAAGVYTLSLPSGDYTVTARHPDYVPVSLPISLASTEDVTQNFTLTPWPYRYYVPLFVWDGEIAPEAP
jgi:subtilisin family serine protease